MERIFYKNLLFVHLVACVHVHPRREQYCILLLGERTILRGYRGVLEGLNSR